MCSRYVILTMTTILLNVTSGKNLASSTDFNIPYYHNDAVNIAVDGMLDEAIWEQIPYRDDFLMSKPDLGEPGRYQTRVRYFYTDSGLYVGMWNEQPTATLLPRLSSRDSFMERDSMQISLDSSGTGLYGYWFSVSLGGSVGDGIILPERDFRRDWDGAWYGNAAATSDGWTAELFIPWAILNMPPTDAKVRKMGVYVSRSLGELGERWTSPYLPSGRFLSALDTFEIKTMAPRQVYNFFPYSSASVDSARQTADYRTGLDVFWRPSSHLQLSATLNPDFGQVEADDIVVNLTAFETFFPEKRLFFLENQEVFSTTNSSSKSPRSTLLNTRRIGSNIESRNGAPDAIDGTGINGFDSQKPVDLIGAVKATGQNGPFRYGVLAAAEDDTNITALDGDSVIVAGRDFGVVRVLYETTGKGGRQSIGWLGTVTDHPSRTAVTHGIDGHLLSEGGNLSLDGQILMSDVGDARGLGFLANASYEPNQRHSHDLEFSYIDDELNLNDLGFLARTDQLSLRYKYKFEESHLPGLKERETEFGIREAQNLNHRKTGGDLILGRNWEYTNNSQTRSRLTYSPEYWDDRDSRDFGDYKRPAIWGMDLRWKSDWASPLSFEFGASAQQEREGGYSNVYQADVTFRPSGRYSISLRNHYGTRDAWLIHSGERNFTAYEAEEWRPRLVLDTFFSAKQQLRIQMEWVGIKAYDRQYWEVPEGGGELKAVTRPLTDTTDGFAISNLSLQARYRWEIAPLSDLFIVYNRGSSLTTSTPGDGFGSLFDNALSDPQNETLVVKLRYRFGPG